MGAVELAECPDAEQLAVPPGAEERDARIEEAAQIEGVDVFGRRRLVGEVQVALQEGANVGSARVVDIDDERVHGGHPRLTLGRGRRHFALGAPARTCARLTPR